MAVSTSTIASRRPISPHSRSSLAARVSAASGAARRNSRLARNETPAIVPLVWLARGRRPKPYPHHIDLVVALPFLLDTAGNTFNLFDSITWWDDFMHVLNWIPWVMVAGFIARYRPLGRLNVALLAWGYGAITHILWEEGEFLAFVQANKNELGTAYRDTMGDLILSLAGGLIGAALVATVLWRPVERLMESR